MEKQSAQSTFARVAKGAGAGVGGAAGVGGTGSTGRAAGVGRVSGVGTIRPPAPNPAMMRRRIDPRHVPLRVDAREESLVPTSASGAEAVVATIHVEQRRRTWLRVLVGVLDVSFPGLPGWTATIEESFMNVRGGDDCGEASLGVRVNEARLRIVEALLGKVGSVAAVHGRVVLEFVDPAIKQLVGELPLGVEHFAGYLGVTDEARRRAYSQAVAGIDAVWDQRRAEQVEEQRNLDPIHIATDASRGRVGAAGIAFVDEEGAHHSAMASACDVSEAEFLAVHMAVGKAISRYGHRPIVVLCDSTRTVAAVRGTWTPHWAVGKRKEQLEALRERMAEYGARIEWVRGHAGHELNELADRLAVHRRRCTESGVAADDIRRREADIVRDVLGAE